MKLTVIIVNYNLKKDTAECIQSILDAGAHLSQLIAVDNGSSDDSAQYLRSTFGNALNIIRTEDVRGYAHGLNLGVRLAYSFDSDWLLLMSNDTFVDQEFLKEMEVATHHFPKVSIFGPMILFASLPNRIWFLGQYLAPGTMLTYDPYRMKPADQSYPDILNVDFLNGCCFLVHRSVIDKIGLLDASLFMYAEEVDFFWRAKKAGFKMAAVPKARMWHKVSAIMSQDKPVSRFLRIRNQIWVYRRYGKWWQIVIMFVFTALRLVIMGIKDIFLQHWNLVTPLLRGFLDGWFQKMPSFSE